MSRLTAHFCSMVLLVAPSMHGSLHAPQTAPPDPRQIVQQVYEQATFRSLEMRASLTTYDRQEHSQKKEFLYRRLNNDLGSETRVDITAPAEEKGVVLLAIQQHGLPANQYVYTPAIDRVRSLGAQDRNSRFLGSDFLFDDFADRKPGDFTYRLLGDGEKIDGNQTYKIESRPVDQSRSPYAYVYLWVAKNAPVIVFAQMYTAQGAMTRVLHATDLRREGVIWGTRRTEVRTVAEHTRTVLTLQNVRINPPLEEAIFSPQGLASPAPAKKR